ncbi:MAG: GNAT family N-acetyltransferase [Ponticaulis sp.]|nr:GNAT family N-acetyltransferase [Ponticaulis sp.]
MFLSVSETPCPRGKGFCFLGDVMALRLLDIDRDLEAFHRFLSDFESVKYMMQPPVESKDETLAMLTRWTKGYEDTSWAIYDPPEMDTLGRISMFRSEDGVWEVGVMLLPEARGRGLAADAVIEAMRQTFSLKDTDLIRADIDPENLASVRVFERIGYVKTGYDKGNVTTHIGLRDSVYFEMTRGAFEARYGA